VFFPLLKKYTSPWSPFLWIVLFLPVSLVILGTLQVARAEQKEMNSRQIQTNEESPRSLSQSPLAQIKAIDFYTGTSGKVLLLITANKYVQPEIRSIGAKRLLLRLPETELPGATGKIIDIPPNVTTVASVEPKSNSQSRAVEFYIELNESVPYSIKISGNEIRLEFDPGAESLGTSDQPGTDSKEKAVVLTLPDETIDTELTLEDYQEGAAALAGEAEVETDKTQQSFPSEAGEESELSYEEMADYLPGHSKFDAFIDELFEGFRYEFRLLPTETTNNISDSPANPQNILEIPAYIIGLEVRPDFYLNYRKLRLSFQPRNTFTWQKWNDGIKAGEDDFDVDLFINYWLAGLQMTDSLWLSYGRENLQWGPSYYVSPSNPFFGDNGLANPKREVPGQDFARAVWVPTSGFSASLIANTNEGEAEYLGDFERVYGLKLDLTGYRKYLSLIGSYREDDRARLGGYAGWTALDGLLIYFEGQVSQGTDALYPVESDETLPTGEQIIVLEETQKNSDSLEAELLWGVSYTFEVGPTVTLEYFLNTPGYDDNDVDLIFELADQVDRALALPPILQNLAGIDLDLSRATNVRLRRLRKNYLICQYQHPNIRNVLSIAVRYAYNLDDNGSQLNPIIQYDLNDNTQLFGVGTQNFGDKEDEFRLFVDYSYFIGLQYTF
jgi:hypothetical protein